jgi:hypothetical protein
MLIRNPGGMVCPMAQTSRWHLDIPVHGEAHGQQGVPMPLDDRYLRPPADVIGDIEDKDAPYGEDPFNLTP